MYPTAQIAENHIRVTRSLFNEGMRAVENKEYKKAIQKTTLLIAVLYLTVAVWLWYTGGSLFFLFGESVFLAALLFWLFIMLPNTKRRSKYKAMAQDAANIPERTIKFYQDQLSITANTGKTTVIPYDDILNWQVTKNLYILSCSNNVCVLLDKKGFVAGDFLTVKSKVFKE